MFNFAETSLSEQLGLNQMEIQRRLHLLNITETDNDRLRRVLPVLEKELTQIVENFYRIQVQDEVISSIIGDIDTLNRLHVVMKRYIATLFFADHSVAYVNDRLRIGKVHKRLNVSPALYMRAQNLLREMIESFIEKNIHNSKETIESFRKAMIFDTELIFESYVDSFVSDAENAQKEVDKFANTLGISINQIATNTHAFYTKDTLTGLYNRRQFDDYLAKECEHAKRYELPLTLIYFDLNNFKNVNDEFGHLVGDEILGLVGNSVLTNIRAVDIPARFGGDEFCIIMPRTKITEAARPIRNLIHHFSENCPYPVTLSIGIAQTGPTSILAADDFVHAADQAMYRAKSRSRKDGDHHIEPPELIQ